MSATTTFYLMCLTLVLSQAQDQSWSLQSHLDVEYSMYCNDSSFNFTGRGDVSGVWTKLDYNGDLMTDHNFRLTDRNLTLVIKKVTNDLAGIYFCEVIAQSGDSLGRVVKGLNVVEHLYLDTLDKYGTDIIRGVITAAAVVVLVVGVCLVDRFQYRSEEEKQTIRDRADTGQKRLRQASLEGAHNDAMEDGSGAFKRYGSLKVDEVVTAF